MGKFWVLLIPAAASVCFLPSYSKTARERMPGSLHVRQLTFDTERPDAVINEFAVASPDGKYFVVQRSSDPKLVKRPDGTQVTDFKETSNWDIFRFDLGGGERRQLTNEHTSEDQPTWSPDGKTLVYRKLNGKQFDLYLMDADGGNKRELLIDPAHDEKTPAFSRDGKKVVFFSNRDGIQWNLYSIDVDTREVTRLTHDRVEDKHPQYLPDGKIVFHSNRNSKKVMLEGGEEFHLMNLFVLDPKTGAITQITRSDDMTTSETMRDNRHAWVSPDGRFIAYHSNIIEEYRNKAGIYHKKHRELCIVTADGKRRVYLTPADHRNFKHPTWSADGKGLFFVYKEKGKAWNAGFADVSGALTRLE